MEITYKTTGVDFDCDNKINNHLEKILDIDLVKNFASLFYISKSNSQKNVALAATCDGVGTKIIPLLKYKMFKTIANDLVAMNFNDLATKGAYPLFFLDYIANNNISVESLKIF
ncbi:MAG: AIR synthase related protein [Candidatus Melainabacteria bacterium]|nr:MAG: AIR synthase related protein [Candidatus Melainabacteria bacterium]